MPSTQTQHSVKRAVNLTVNQDLLAEARELKINLSQVFEKAIKEISQKLRREKWLKENKSAMEAYNRFVENHGVFGDEFRSF